MNALYYTVAINLSNNVNLWVKANDSLEKCIFRKILQQKIPIANFFKGSHKFSLAMRMMYWGKSFVSLQPVLQITP